MWYSNSKKYINYHDINYKVRHSSFKLFNNEWWGLQILQNVIFNEHMLTAIIRLCKKSLSKKSKILLYTYPDRFFSSKPQEVRMGKGKGNPSLRIVQYKKGTIFMKIYSFDSNFIIETCLKQCLDRLPIDAKIIRPFASKW